MNSIEIEKIAASVSRAFTPSAVKIPTGCGGFSDPQGYNCRDFSCAGDYQCGGVAGFGCSRTFSCDSGFFCSCVYTSPES